MTSLILASALNLGRVVDVLLRPIALGHNDQPDSYTQSEAGATIDQSTDYYGTALSAAAAGGHEEVLTILLDAGADMDVQNVEHGNALVAAAGADHEHIVELLIQRGAGINAPGYDGTWHTSPLCTAIHERHTLLAELLIDHGADVNCGRISQRSPTEGAHLLISELIVEPPLWVATDGCWLEGVQLLLRNQASVNEAIKETWEEQPWETSLLHTYANEPAFFVAVSEGHDSAIVREMLAGGARVDTKSSYTTTETRRSSDDVGGTTSSSSSRTVLAEAVDLGHTEVIALLLEHGAEVDDQALTFAWRKGKETILAMLHSRKQMARGRRAEGDTQGLRRTSLYAERRKSLP